MSDDNNLDTINYMDSSLGDNSSFVYRFLDRDSNIIYVGKTKNLRERMKIHFSKQGHLSKECIHLVDRIEYIQFTSSLEASIRELYYINKYKPQYNQRDKFDSEECILQLPDKEWMVYRYSSQELIQELESRNKELVKENKDLKDKYEKNVAEVNRLKDAMIEKDEYIRTLTNSFIVKTDIENNKSILEVKENINVNYEDAVEILTLTSLQDLRFYSEWFVNGRLNVKVILYKDHNGEVYVYYANMKQHTKASELDKRDIVKGFTFYCKEEINPKILYSIAFKKYSIEHIINNFNQLKGNIYIYDKFRLSISEEDNTIKIYSDNVIRDYLKNVDISNKKEIAMLVEEYKNTEWYDYHYNYIRNQI